MPEHRRPSADLPEEDTCGPWSCEPWLAKRTNVCAVPHTTWHSSQSRSTSRSAHPPFPVINHVPRTSVCRTPSFGDLPISRSAVPSADAAFASRHCQRFRGLHYITNIVVSDWLVVVSKLDH